MITKHKVTLITYNIDEFSKFLDTYQLDADIIDEELIEDINDD